MVPYAIPLKDATKSPVVLLHPRQQFILIVALERSGGRRHFPSHRYITPNIGYFRVGKVAQAWSFCTIPKSWVQLHMPTGYTAYRTVCIENDHWNATSWQESVPSAPANRTKSA